MTVGTKSLLFGIHQFILHPILLAMAWTRLYGFPFHPILWACFFFHDIGYFGKMDMDGETEGQTHPELGAKIITKLFGKEWGDFCLYHSRFYCRTNRKQHSKLCVADKLAFCMYPPKLYCFLARLSGELALYKEFSEDVNELPNAKTMSDLEWYHGLKRYTLRVVIQTNHSYHNHVHVGYSYHEKFLNRIINSSTGWKRKPVIFRAFNEPTCRLRAKLRRESETSK
jgi:hypothetical protein